MIRQFIAIVCAAITALILQSSVTVILPEVLIPDLVLLVVISSAVLVSPAQGLLVASGVGYAVDILSGSLFGHHALLRLFVFVIAYFTSRKFHLTRPLNLLVFVLIISLVDSIGTVLLSKIFKGAFLIGTFEIYVAGIRALLNAVSALVVLATVKAFFAFLTRRDDQTKASKIGAGATR